ncbi:hypothetical protein ACM66B_006872 [Microbotryomycetes sp. NB124-2]
MQKLKGLSLPTFSSSSSQQSGSSTALTAAPVDDGVRSSLAERHKLLKTLSATCQRLHKTHIKLKPHPLAGITSEKDQLLVWLATDLSSGAEAIEHATTDGSASDYVASLKALGSAELALARHHSSCADNLDNLVLHQLDDLLRQYKEYEKALKDADKLRTVLESKLSKKAKSGAEDDSEVQAELDYDDACTSLTQLATHLWAGLATEQDVVTALLDAQLELARQSFEELQACKDQFSAFSSRPSKPVSPVLTRAIPRAITRPSRSASDSNALRPPTLSFASVDHDSRDRPSSSGSNRRSTLSEGFSAKSSSTSQQQQQSGSGSSTPKRPDNKNRSRSSSMLSRLAPNSILGRNKKNGGIRRDDDDDDDENEYDEETGQRSGDEDDRNGLSPNRSRGGHGSRSVGHSPNRSRLSPSALRSSFVKGGGVQDDDDGLRRDILSGVSLGRTEQAGTSATTSLERKRTPLKRTHTAPANPQASSLTSTNRDFVSREPVRQASKPTPRRGRAAGAEYVQAKWSFKGSSTDELDLTKGDFVRVVSKINQDWWTGQVVASGGRGVKREGMFPRAYVVDVTSEDVPDHEGQEDESLAEDDDDKSDLSRTESKSSRFGQDTTTDEEEWHRSGDDEDDHDDGSRGDKSRFFNGSTSTTTTPRRYLPSGASTTSALAGFGRGVHGSKLKDKDGNDDHANSPFAD